jgi:hypothetical protein
MPRGEETFSCKPPGLLPLPAPLTARLTCSFPRESRSILCAKDAGGNPENRERWRNLCHACLF